MHVGIYIMHITCLRNQVTGSLLGISGFQFLTMGAAHVDLTADRMEVQANNAKPREVGDEKITPKIHPPI